MEKNKKDLIELMKIMKKSNFKSRFTFMLGAGFANHVYKFPLWSEIVEKYLKEKKIKLEKLTSLEKQLILDYAEKNENFYTKQLNNQKQKAFHWGGFKDFYDTLKSNNNITTGFFTTNHCKSIEQYFDVRKRYKNLTLLSKHASRYVKRKKSKIKQQVLVKKLPPKIEHCQ